MSSLSGLKLLGQTALRCGATRSQFMVSKFLKPTCIASTSLDFKTNISSYSTRFNTNYATSLKPNYNLSRYSNLNSILSAQPNWNPTITTICRQFSKKCTADLAGKAETKLAENDIFGEASKLGLFAKFKLMYKKYWYVLIPVHIVTSLGWLGSFYYLSKSGVDVPALLQYIHLSESIINKVQNSDMGHYAIAYLCYKVATPLRYAVTLGGTTVSIKYLVQAGHIKPMPSKQQIIKLYEQKKADRAAAKADKAEKAVEKK